MLVHTVMVEIDVCKSSLGSRFSSLLLDLVHIVVHVVDLFLIRWRYLITESFLSLKWSSLRF